MHIYVIGTNSNKQKIGFSSNVKQRLRSLQTANAEELVLHHTIPVPRDRVRLLEKKLHKELSYRKMKGEWFKITADEAKLLLDFAVIRWLDDPLLDWL